jgi:hypothetical protein
MLHKFLRGEGLLRSPTEEVFKSDVCQGCSFWYGSVDARDKHQATKVTSNGANWEHGSNPAASSI